MRVVELMLRNRPLCAQPEQLQGGNVGICGGSTRHQPPRQISQAPKENEYLCGAGAAELLQALSCKHFVFETLQTLQGGNVATHTALPGTCRGKKGKGMNLLQISPQIQLVLPNLVFREE